MVKKKRKSKQCKETREVVYWFPGNMKQRVTLKRSPLRKISKKRAKQTREYMKLRDVFLRMRPHCEIFEINCTRQSTEVHHTNHREGLRLLEVSNWLPACRSCHTYLHEHPAYARAAGFLK